MSRSEYTGWAVEWTYKATQLDPERRFLVGKFWDGIPTGTFRGHRTAVFETRAEARTVIAKTRSWRSTGKAVKVKVTVETI